MKLRIGLMALIIAHGFSPNAHSHGGEGAILGILLGGPGYFFQLRRDASQRARSAREAARDQQKREENFEKSMPLITSALLNNHISTGLTDSGDRYWDFGDVQKKIIVSKEFPSRSQKGTIDYCEKISASLVSPEEMKLLEKAIGIVFAQSGDAFPEGVFFGIYDVSLEPKNYVASPGEYVYLNRGKSSKIKIFMKGWTQKGEIFESYKNGETVVKYHFDDYNLQDNPWSTRISAACIKDL